MISREFARDQIMRLFVLRDPPREDAGIAEMIDTLQRAARDEQHARAIVDAAVREGEYFPRPCDIYEIAGSTSPARYWESSAEVVRARRARRARRAAAIAAWMAERPELGPLERRVGPCRCYRAERGTGNPRRVCWVDATGRRVLVEHCEGCHHEAYQCDPAADAIQRRQPQRETAAPAAAEAAKAG